VSSKEEKLRREILDYLSRHPRAKDSIEGIVEWWLLEQRIVDTKREVEKVLTQLVTEKLVGREVELDGTVYYHVSPRNGE